MRVLIDTQALLWWLTDSENLGPNARRIFMSDEPVVSPVVIWEIAIKVGLGKLKADVEAVCTAVSSEGFARIGFSDRHLINLARLPLHHRDPFDRMLVVQSQTEQIPLLTSDQKMRLYDAEILDCRA